MSLHADSRLGAAKLGADLGADLGEPVEEAWEKQQPRRYSAIRDGSKISTAVHSST